MSSSAVASRVVPSRSVLPSSAPDIDDTHGEVYLLVGETRVPCRGDLLISAAPHAQRLLETGEPVQDASVCGREIRLPCSLHVRAVETIVEYISRGRMDISGQNALPVLQCAEALGMEASVSDACFRCLGESITRANCLQLRAVASRYSSTQLAEQCDAYIGGCLDKLWSQDEFLALPRIQVNVDASSRVLEMTTDAAIMERLLPSVLSQLEVAAREAASRYRYLEEGVVSLVLPPLEMGEDPRSGEVSSLGGRFLSPEKPSVAIAVKKHQAYPARKLQLDESPFWHGSPAEEQEEDDDRETKPTWKLIAFTKLSELSAVVLVERGFSLIVLSVLLSTAESGDGQLQPASPTTGAPLTGSSALLAQMSVARSGLGVATSGNTLLAIGGFNRHGCHALVERYDLLSNTWKETTRLDRKRARFAAVEVAGTVYAIGGSDGQRELSSIEYFSNSLPSLAPLRLHCPMPTPRSCFGAAVLDDLVYAVGGSRYSVLLKTVERFDPAKREWTTLPPLKTARTDHAVVTCSGKVFVIGGQTFGWKCLTGVECFDPSTGAWSQAAPMATPRRSAAAVTVGDKVWVIGGFSGSKTLKSVEVYDPRSDSWTPGPPILTARSSASAVLVDEFVYLVGGYTGSVFLNSVERCSLAGMSWTAFV